MGYRTRQLITLALAANAHRPLRDRVGTVPGFFAGWFASELTPQLLLLNAADTAQHTLRGKAKAIDLALGVASLGALATLLPSSRGARGVAETTLRDAIGPDYAAPESIPRALSEIRHPFRLSDPGLEVLKDIQYAGTGIRGQLDIYRSRDAHVDAPVLIQVHGGAWVLGRKEEQGRLLMNAMANRGWICVAINYRLAPKHPWPAQIVDVKRAIAWVREHIADYGGDPSYLVITGGSAGGHLAALAAVTPNDPALQPGFEEADTHVDACVPFYGVVDMAGDTGNASVGMRDQFLARRLFLKPFLGNEQDYWDASPLRRLESLEPDQIPDFHVVHGTLDSLVPIEQARAFVALLRKRSRRVVSYTELPGTQHAFEVFGSLRSRPVVDAVARWLEWHHRTHSPARATVTD